MANDNKATMKLWEREYIKSVGQDLLVKTIKYLNNEIGYPEYEQIRKEHAERFRPFNDISAKNYEAFFIYDEIMTMLINLRLEYRDILQQFNNYNSDILYVLQLMIISEVTIKGEMEYNTLLSRIPAEAKEQMGQEWTKRKNVEETIDTMASLEYAIGKEKTTDAPSRLLDTPTYLYCQLECIKLIYETICEKYNIKEKMILKEAVKQDTYMNVCKNITQLFVMGQERVKDFSKTLFYKRFLHYYHIKEVVKKKAYKEAEAKAKEHIIDYIENNIKSADKGLLLLEELLDILFKQRWWFVDE